MHVKNPIRGALYVKSASNRWFNRNRSSQAPRSYATGFEQSRKRQGRHLCRDGMRLSKAFGSSPEVWLGMQMEYDLA